MIEQRQYVIHSFRLVKRVVLLTSPLELVHFSYESNECSEMSLVRV